MIIGGGASGSPYTPPATRSARVGRARAGSYARAGARRAPPRRYGGGGGGGTSRFSGSRPAGGRGIAVARSHGGQARATGTAQTAAPRAPRYAGPPPPSAASIAQLAEQLGGIGRRYNEAGASYKSGVSQAGSARTAFLQQLNDYFTGQQNQTAESFQARGLSQSGLYNEALANLGKQRAAQQGSYETDYRKTLSDLLGQLTSTRSDLRQQKATLSDRYQQSRADRARILSLMGG